MFLRKDQPQLRPCHFDDVIEIRALFNHAVELLVFDFLLLALRLKCAELPAARRNVGLQNKKGNDHVANERDNRDIDDAVDFILFRTSWYL